MRAFTLLILATLTICGQTPDSPKRTIFDSRSPNLRKPDAPAAEAAKPSPRAPETGRAADSSALDALISSTENLNAIRDSNVRKLTGDGCAPEVSARIHDLRSRLGITPPSEKKNPGSEPAALALASSWFKGTPDGAPVASQQKKSDLLDSVLPGAEKTAKPAEPQDRDAGELKVELEHLLASCAGTKR